MDLIIVWLLRIAFLGALLLVCRISDSTLPSLAFALAWGPNGIFLAAFAGGKLKLPRRLAVVHSVEPPLYRMLGVGLAKRIVANRFWPMLVGFPPPPRAASRAEQLERVRVSAECAEICHLLTFVLVLLVAIVCLFMGRYPAAAWMLAFNILLNGYPVMLQRLHRSRLQRLERKRRQEQPATS